MKRITELLRERRIYFDGGLGTMLQNAGLKPGQPPEDMNLAAPDVVSKIHRLYIEAGSNVITANTFGATPLRRADWEVCAVAGMRAAREAAKGTNAYVAFDMSTNGRLLEPFGDLPFEEAVSSYARVARLAEAEGADLLLVETMNDCLETKAAVIAAKENSCLPVFVTNVYDADGKLMTGADPGAMIAMLEGLGADAIGMNCSIGPDAMIPLAGQFTELSSLPVIVNPNAGIPVVRDGKTVYGISAEEFADYMVQIASTGAAALGGCCGTTPEYIRLMVERTRGIPYEPPVQKNITAVSSNTHAVYFSDHPVLIGERLNPTGKPSLKQAIVSRDNGYLMKEAIRQGEAGADILDLNVGVPGTNERENMLSAVRAIQSVTDLPLQLDTTNCGALEDALRGYIGKPLVNSVNGTKESMESVLPLVKKYGAAVIALAIGEDGIPDTAAGRAAVIEKIVARAQEYGIKRCDIIADPLALTLSADTSAALTTLEAVRLIHAKGIKTSLGVSNVSFGLPDRETVNAAFFSAALEAGLDCAIMNPFSVPMMKVYRTYNLIHGLDPACGEYISFACAKEEKPVDASDTPADLPQCIRRGLREASVAAAGELLKGGADPLGIINDSIIPALNSIGDDFGAKRAFLPQLLMSAEAATAAIQCVRERIPRTATESAGRVILATVRGDVHDIGKNIVRVLLESYGFAVTDLGRDVPPEEVLRAVKETGCRLVGLSALMTTTVPAMEKTVRLLHEGTQCRVIVGGAVLTPEYAREIGADCFARDAMETVRLASAFYSEKPISQHTVTEHKKN